MNSPLTKVGVGLMVIAAADSLIIALYTPSQLAWAPILLATVGLVLFVVGMGSEDRER